MAAVRTAVGEPDGLDRLGLLWLLGVGRLVGLEGQIVDLRLLFVPTIGRLLWR